MAYDLCGQSLSDRMHIGQTCQEQILWPEAPVQFERTLAHYERRAIIQRDAIEHQQIIYISSNRRMKQLMD